MLPPALSCTKCEAKNPREQIRANNNMYYKNHKFLVVACTPNGAISIISPLYLGSISDPTLTRVWFYSGMSGVSIMADRGFTIKEVLSKIGV